MTDKQVQTILRNLDCDLGELSAKPDNKEKLIS